MPAPELLAHPFSSYSQKVLVALYENGTDFVYRSLEDADAQALLAQCWPMKRFPVLRDGERAAVKRVVAAVEGVSEVKNQVRAMKPMRKFTYSKT